MQAEDLALPKHHLLKNQIRIFDPLLLYLKLN